MWLSCSASTPDIQMPEFQTEMIFSISLPACYWCVRQTVHNVPWQSLCLYEHFSSCCGCHGLCYGYYLSPWWSLLFDANPLPCTMVVGGVCCAVFPIHHGGHWYVLWTFRLAPWCWLLSSVEPFTLHLTGHIWLCRIVNLVPWQSLVSAVGPVPCTLVMFGISGAHFTLNHGHHWCHL
jgi:hypothetical protein